MGMLLTVFLLWLVLALGSLDKHEKFWSIKTIILTVVFAISAVASAVSGASSKSLTDAQEIHEAMRVGLGAAGGLVYCIVYSEKIKGKRFPLAAGLSPLLISIGCLYILSGVVRWLDGLR